ncbi:hypothetical protein NAT51_13140 [Flavobacterium amniphilum]|uniref:hypothetical protein n=1 Tax=Flavobacterium amniphilum TaxID=1834035 RepID=UPI00202AB4F3|nr:hypothetical protein [Flavobacterium amniphilum]MCL9806476.1 hypothetical protein [Flavobacterium amniphilum]
MKHLLFILIILSPMISFGQNIGDNVLYENYKKALNTCNSTAPSFLVITYKDLNQNTIKEVCLESPDLISALMRELKLTDYTGEQIQTAFDFALNKKDRYFEFSNPKAIERVNPHQYSLEDLKKFSIEKDIAKIAKKFNKEKKGKIYPENELETIKYAHTLFNAGLIMGTNNCMGGMTIFCTNWSNE